MNLITYLKDPKTWVVVVLIIVGSLGYLYLNREYTRVTTEYKQQISTLETSHLKESDAWKKDSTSMLDSIKVTVHKLDSMFTVEKESSKTHQVIYRTIYKDSIIEVITTDTEVLKERDQTIVKLNDSVASSKKIVVSLRDSITTLKDSLGKKKVQVVTEYKHDTLTIKPGDKKFMIGGGAFVEADNKLNLNYGVHATADYKIFDPIYIGAGLQKDGFIDWKSGYKLQLRTGVKYDF